MPLNRWCVISAIGTRWGLCCAATRVVSFDKPDAAVMEAFQAASLVQASAVYFSQAGVPFSEIWPKVRRIYEKVERPDEWRAREQADVIGYLPSELALVPNLDRPLEPQFAVHWHPGIGPIPLGDTLLVTPEAPEIITTPDEWPLLGITVKGQPVNLPDLLIR
jgi:Xaa-Pro dipeptidase